MKQSDTTMHNTSPNKIGVVLRIGTFTIQTENRVIDVVEAHNDVVKRFGKAAVAKFGRRPALKRLELLQDQIQIGPNPFLAFVSRHGNDFKCFSSPISEIVLGPTLPPDRFIPSYYGSRFDPRVIWFIIKDIFQPFSLSDICLTTSRTPIMESLKVCRTSFFFVRQSGPVSQ